MVQFAIGHFMARSLLLVVFLQAFADMLYFFTSPSTPFDLELVAAQVAPSRHLRYSVQILATVAETKETSEEGLLFDYTYEQTLTSALKYRNPDVFVMWSDDSARLREYGEMFSRYIEALQFTRVTLISDSKQSNLQLSQFLIQTYPSVYDELCIIPYNADEDFCLRFIGEFLKPSGVNLFAIVTDEVTAMNLLIAFETKKLDKEGYAYVLSSQASYYQHLTTNSTGLLSTGTLYVTDAETALARSLEEAEELRLMSILGKLESSQTLSETSSALSHSFVLVNIDESVPKIITSDPADIGLSELRITFPGNTSKVPIRSKAVIQTSVNYELIDSTGYLLQSSSIVMRGVKVAFQETNNRTDIIPNFHVNDFTVGFSGLTFNYTFTKTQILNNLTHIGVIHIPAPFGTNIIQTFQIFQELNVTKPMTIGSGSSALSSPRNYPMYVRAKTSNAYTALVMARMFSYFGWKRAAILYSVDEGDHQDFYNNFMNLTSTFGINITNEERMRGITPNIPIEVTAEVNASISDIMNSTVRIIIILHNDLFIILEAMYDLGVRSEYLICTWFGISYTFLNGNIVNYHKHRVVAKGALQFYPTPFIGEQGAKVLSHLKAWDGKNYYPNTCYFYDCTMLYMYSTDYMISRGIDYEDPYEIVKAMKGTRFVGCAGTISIAPDSNDRAAAQYSVSNAKYYENNETVVVEDVMYYNPFSSTLYQKIKPIMWPDNSTTVFTDTLISNCPFLEKQVRDFPPGHILGYGVSFGICGLTGLCCLLIWRRWWNVWHPMLESSCEISAEDYMQLASLFIEFLQFAAVGPKAGSLSYFLAALCEMMVLDLDQIIEYSRGQYWTVINATLGCVGLYLLLCIIKLTGFEKKLECLPLVSFVLLWADLSLPTFSNLISFPILSVLSNIFLCFKSIGDEFFSSFFNEDCYQFCWQGFHITYTVLCSTALVIYIPVGIFTKPLWQEMQPNLHIRAQPPSLMVKSFAQVLLLTLSHTLRNDYPTVHAGLYFSVIACYIAYLSFFKTYNYGRYAIFRLNMWQALVMMAVLIFGIVSFISQMNSDFSDSCLLSLLLFFVLLTTIGLVLQAKVSYFGCKLYRRSHDSSAIINFAFSFGKRAAMYLERHRMTLRQEISESNNVIGGQGRIRRVSDLAVSEEVS